MSYIVYTSSGTILTTVPTGKVNTNTTSLTLIGRDVTNYGRYYNQNLVNLLGNFEYFYLFSYYFYILLIKISI